MADHFFDVKDIDITRYADDSMPFIVQSNIDNVIVSLEQVSDVMCNCLKSNSNKCHVLVSTKKPVSINTGDYRIDNSEFEKLLSRKVGVNVHFNDHISDLLKKASGEISTLAAVTPFVG